MLPPGLAAALGNDLHETCKRRELFEDEAGSDAVGLLVVSGLEDPETFPPADVRQTLRTTGSQGLGAAAELLKRRLEEEPGDAGPLWRDKIGPFVKQAWPQETSFVDPAASYHLSLATVEAGSAFGDAVQETLDLMTQIDEVHGNRRLTERLRKGELPEKFPHEMIRLLDKVLCRTTTWPDREMRDGLVDVVQRTQQAAPDFAGSAESRRINEYLDAVG